MVRILYVMHVDWRWIKQRPHFLAEGLANHFQVVVIYRPHWRRLKFPRNRSRIRRLPLIPIPRHWGKVCRMLDRVVNRAWLYLLRKFFGTNLVWLTFPSLHGYLPETRRSSPVIYDCMDDALAFPGVGRETTQELAVAERRLAAVASIIFCSSQTLCNLIKSRYAREDAVLVRNALSEKCLKDGLSRAVDHQPGAVFNLAYLGTISSWFDFPSICHLLDHIPNLVMHLFGPLEVALPQHARLRYHGVVDHDDLHKTSHGVDAFIMPFVVSPLVAAVDPVKMYEYLAFQKPVISIFYEEIRRYEGLALFYSDAATLRAIVEALMENRIKPVSASQIRDFLSQNTWKKRTELVTATLHSFLPHPVSQPARQAKPPLQNH